MGIRRRAGASTKALPKRGSKEPSERKPSNSVKAALDQHRANTITKVSKEDIQKYLQRYDKMSMVLNRRRESVRRASAESEEPGKDKE